VEGSRIEENLPVLAVNTINIEEEGTENLIKEIGHHIRKDGKIYTTFCSNSERYRYRERYRDIGLGIEGYHRFYGTNLIDRPSEVLSRPLGEHRFVSISAEVNDLNEYFR